MSEAEKLAAVGAENEMLDIRLYALNEAFDTLAERYRLLSARCERLRISLNHTEKCLTMERAGPTSADDAELMAECFSIYERWTK